MSPEQRSNGTRSTPVTTVQGTIRSDELGVTLPHEHLSNDLRTGLAAQLAAAPDQYRTLNVTPETAWMLREHPYDCAENCQLADSHAEVLADLQTFRAHGGNTVIDLTSAGAGQDLQAMRQFSAESGLNVIAGCGWYLESYDPEPADLPSPEELAGQLVEAATDPARPIRPGVIGEIGVSPSFTPVEQLHLRAACLAQQELRIPLFIHMPGWKRYGLRVARLCADAGADPSAVVLCHMDPSGADRAYQDAVAATGIWMEFDMIGMPYRYPGEGQSPAPADTARAVARLLDRGSGDRMLFSHDLFLKSMLSAFGGNGLSYVRTMFSERLADLGVGPDLIERIQVQNPRALFECAAAH